MTVIFEHFKTLNELTETIEKRPLNKVFAGERPYSETLAPKNDPFYYSASYDDASELLKSGYREPLERMKAEILKVEKNAPTPRQKRFKSISGYAPHVPNAIQGIPLSMFNRKNTPKPSKTIHLLYGFSAVGRTRAEDLIKGGVMFISLVNSLERAGYRVKIDIVRCTTTSTRNAIGYTCNLKEYSQPLNLLKLCYPLVHPSMLRRTSFKWCETLPKLTDRGYKGTYGVSLIMRFEKDSNKERAFLREHGILNNKNMYYCNVYEAMESQTVSELAIKIGLQQ